MSIEHPHRPLQEQIDEIRGQLAANTELTKLVHDNTKDIVKFFQDAQGTFSILERVSKLAKPLLWLTGFLSITINWATIKAFFTAIFHVGPK